MGEQQRVFMGLCLCSTGLELDVKEQVRKMVVACGGRFQDDLDPTSTTHLIANVVGSPKYRAAVAHKLPVASPRWIFASFRAQKLLNVQDFGLKLLEGMGVCTSGLSVEEKEMVEQVVTRHGAQYDGRLELGFTNVLIAEHPKGAKYEAAVAHDIPVVHLGWLNACITRQMVVQEDEFALPLQAEEQSTGSGSGNHEKEAQEVVAALPEYVKRYQEEHKDDGDDREKGEWMELFDGCVVYLLGFSPFMHLLLQRMIRTGMGTIFHHVVIRQVTHVVVSASLSDKQTLTAIQTRVRACSAASTVHFVSATWVLDCVKCLTLQREDCYPIEFNGHIPTSVHQSDTSASSIAGDSIPSLAVDQEGAEVAEEVNSDPIVLSEDIRLDTDKDRCLTTSAKTNCTSKGPRSNIFAGYSFLLLCRDPEDQHVIKPMLENIRGERGGAEAIAIAAIDFPHVDAQHFAFVSHAVVCTGVVMDEQEALKTQERIHQFQRHVLKPEQDEGVDSEDGMRPVKRMRHDGKPRRRMLQFVSDLWVNCSLAARTKLSFSSHELFGISANYPRALFTNPVPLPGFQHVVASTSVYRDIEQLVVIELLRIAGARVTKTLSAQNTHLLCLMPFGMKYEKATKRKLHVVRARWVVDSLVAGKRLSEEAPEFQVVDGDETSTFTRIASGRSVHSAVSPRCASA